MSKPLFNIPGAERQTLDWIVAWHSSMADALIDRRASVQLAIETGTPVAPRFTGMTPAEVDDHYDEQRRELDRLTMLNLVASAEASITDDYFRRIELKLKDRLSRDYRAWYKGLSNKKKDQPPFDEAGILNQLKRSMVVDNNVVGQFRQCLRVRHWVGHGRRWSKPLEVENFDPDDVYDRANALLNALPV